jgi:hypothetical protein
MRVPCRGRFPASAYGTACLASVTSNSVTSCAYALDSFQDIALNALIWCTKMKHTSRQEASEDRFGVCRSSTS